ncbi:MAG TPA: hypothetical protein VN426_02165 [Syntrophomonadaceae bacterium]|nr:hypothetical protein [Syntrophomonadaceae bacterium]
MQNTSMDLQRGEGVGVVYFQNGEFKVHDGVLRDPIANGDYPPDTVTIVHYRVYQSGPNMGKLERQSRRKLKNVVQVLRTPDYPELKLICPNTSNPDLDAGIPVVVKIKVPVSPAFPSGHDAKNGVLVCAVQDRLSPKGNAWINHWKIIAPNKPDVYLDTKQYTNAEFLRAVVV